MIFTDRTIMVKNGTSSINDTIVLYRGDREVEIRFTLNEGTPFKFGSGASPNIIEKTEATYGQLVIKTPGALPPIFSEVTPTIGGKIIFTITAEMIDETTEVGNYTFQIRLLDDNMESRATLPEVKNGIEIREPIALEDISTTNEVGVATVGYAVTTAGTTEDAFDSQGNYNKTTWVAGDRITASKLNKIEAGIDGVNNKIAEAQLNGGSGSTGTDTDTDVSVGARPWANYKWACIGDSLTDSTINANTKYHQIIADATGITVQELAKGGTGYTAGYDSSSTFYDRIANIAEDTDIVTLFGSVNDWKNNEHNTLCPQIGTANDVYDDSQTVIQNTFCANLNKTFNALFAKVPTAQVIVFGAMPYYGVNDTYFDNVRKALIDVCAKRHIPYVDMFDATGFYRIMDNATYAAAYTTDFTGTNFETEKSFGHPNNEAHRKIIAPKFYAKLKEYLPITHKVQSGGGTTPVLCTGVSLDANSLTFETNATQTLNATFTPSNTTQSKVWSSDNSSIATVANGVVTPVANGSCNITITCGNFSATCSVTVNMPEEPGSGGDSGSTPDFVNYAYNTDTYTNPTTTDLPQKNTYYFFSKMDKSVSDGVLTMTKNPGLASGVNSYALFKLGIGDNNKYYYRALLRTSSRGVTAGINGDGVTVPSDNEWHLISYIGTDTSANSNGYAIDFVNAQVDGPVEFKEFMKINLTEIYGAGNEPDKATCDATFTTYKTGLIG